MSWADYLVGLIAFVGTVGSVAGASVLLVRRGLPHLRGAAAVLAFVIIATAGLIAVHLLPGVLGLLSRWAAGLCGLVVLALAWQLPTVGGRAAGAQSSPLEDGGRAWSVAAAVVGYAAVNILDAARHQAAEPATGSVDTLTFHLPTVARWIQSGSFWQVDQFVPLLAHGNYPNNGDVVFLAAILPWHNDAFARLVNWPYAVIGGLAVYALARELRAPRSASILFGAVLVTLPTYVGSASAGALTDPILLATFGAGLLFLVRHFRTARTSDLILAGGGLGLAFGTKWYGVSSVVAVLAAWAVACLLARRPVRLVVRQAALLGALVLLSGGFWLLRNWVESGNPIFPVKARLFGQTIFEAPPDVIRERLGFSIAHYIDRPGVLGEFVAPALKESFGAGGVLLVLGALLAGVLCVGVRRLPEARRAASLCALAVLLVAVYALTPYTAFGPDGRPVNVEFNTRYVLPALVVAAVVSAWAGGALGRLRVGWELLAAAAVVEGARRGFDLSTTKLAATLALGGALGLAVVAGCVRVPRVSRPQAAVAVATCLLALIALGDNRQRAFNELRYRSGDPALAWVTRNAPEGRRIGLTGEWTVAGLSPVLPAFGPRFGNDVEYVGRFVRGFLRAYDTKEQWLAAIRRRGYDLLVIGRGRPVQAETVEERWARSIGFREVVRSDRFALYADGRGGSEGDEPSHR